MEAVLETKTGLIPSVYVDLTRFCILAAQRKVLVSAAVLTATIILIYYIESLELANSFPSLRFSKFNSNCNDFAMGRKVIQSTSENSGEETVLRCKSQSFNYHANTSVTFNLSLVVYCQESPFVLCSDHSENTKLEPNPDLANKTFKVVMLRRQFWLRRDDFTNCKGRGKCVLQGEHRSDITEDTDVVHMYGVEHDDSYTLPVRWPHQLYAVSSWEAPYYTQAGYLKDPQSPWNNQFNITISYRLDADVFTPYHKLVFDPKPIDKRPNYRQIAERKTKTAAWFVSNCHVPSRREEYVEEMKKYIDIDVFGSCGNMNISCPYTRRIDYPCNSIVNATYKFYLSFENSLCKDYITEKFLKVFTPENYVIPVVRGGADYDKYFPEFTYINAAHFKTARDLALFLKKLASDVTRYSKYLEYKDLYRLHDEGFNSTYHCNLCEYLHSKNNQPQVYDIRRWMTDGVCRRPYATEI